MRARTTIALALLLALSACGGPDDPPTDTPSSEVAPSETPEGAGPIDAPAPVEPEERLLDWQDTGVAAGTRYLKGAEWEALANEQNTTVELARDGQAIEIAAGAGRTISEVLMDEAWAVVVKQDKAETAPSQAAIIDLATGDQREIVTPEPASGGSWAMAGGDLYYPTYGDGRAYCLATLALADANGEDGWCAPKRSGWSGLAASEHGVGIMTFDDRRPVSCRTVNLIDGSGIPQPVEGPRDCTVWDVAATAAGAVWSDVPKPRRQEEAHFYASVGDGYYDLGPGTTGSLLPCGDSVFFVRDPQGNDDPAQLMRWTPGLHLEIAYASESVGNAFLGEPACAGGVLTLSSFGESGDEQVFAFVTSP